MGRPCGEYRVVDKKTNSLIAQGSREEIADKLKISTSSVKNLVTRGSLQYSIYFVCDLYKYKNKTGTIQELADEFGVTYHHIHSKKKLIGTQFIERGYRADKKMYALYEGENLKATGTAAEIIDSGITTPSGFYIFLYKAAEVTGDKAKCVVIIEEND